MKKQNYIFNILITCLFICFLGNVPLLIAEEFPPPAQQFPGSNSLITPTLEYSEFLMRIAEALFNAYVVYHTDAEEIYETTTLAVRDFIIGGNYEESIALLDDLINNTLLPIQDKFCLFISEDGLHILQTPYSLTLQKGERGYVTIAVLNETSQVLNLSLSSINTSTRFVSPQVLSIAPGSEEYASLVLPVIEVISYEVGEQVVPINIEITMAATSPLPLFEPLNLYLNIEINEFTPQPCLFSYQPSRQSTESEFTTSLAIADIDNNGFLDIYSGNYSYPQAAANIVYYGQGKGAFNTQTVPDTGGPKGTREVAAVDIDGDGIIDNIIEANVNVDIGDAQNIIRSFPTLNPAELNQNTFDTTKVIAEDLNLNDSDSKTQLLVCNIDERIQLFKNDNSGGFELSPSWESLGKYVTMGLGDVDGDGVKDLAASPGGYLIIYRGQVDNWGNISFEENFSDPLWATNNKVVALRQLLFDDFDNDGDQDFFVVAKEIRLYRNEPTGILGDEPYWSLELPYQSPSTIAVADINNDGLKDLVVGFYAAIDLNKRLLGGENKIFLGKTEGGQITFDTVPAWSSFFSDKTLAIGVEDLNQDGYLDLVVGNDGQNYIYFNLGPKIYFPTLPAEPSSFYKGNIHSQITIQSHEPGSTIIPVADASQTIGYNADIDKVSEAAELQQRYEEVNLKVAGFWSSVPSPFEGMFYFNLIDTEITAVKEGGAEAIMLFNPVVGDKWMYAAGNEKSIDNLDTYAWIAEKFAQRYGPSGLLAQVNNWSPNYKVLYGTTNEPEAQLWPTPEIVVKKQDCLFNVVKEVDENILVTTANHGGGAWAIADFNNVAQGLGLPGYYKFDIARIQTYYTGLSKLGLADDDEHFYFDEFFSPSFPDWLMDGQVTRDMLANPNSYWANFDYEVVSGEGNGNTVQALESYLPGEPPYSSTEIPFYSQSQEAITAVGGYLRNISNLMPYIATNTPFCLPASTIATELLVEMLQDHHYAGVQAEPEILNEGKVIVYKFEDNSDSTYLYALRAHPGYADAPFEAQTVTLNLQYPDSLVLIKNMLDGQQFTGNDVVAATEDYLTLPLADRWVTVENVTHGQYNQTNLIYNVENGQITITLPNYDYYYIKEVTPGTNLAPVLEYITTPQYVTEGETLTIPISASDPDVGDILTFSYSPATISNTQFNQLSNNSAEFIFSPDHAQAGTYYFTFSVNDQGNLSDSQEVRINVLPGPNQSPQFTNLPGPQTIAEGETLTFSVSATDPDNDPLTFGFDNAPAGFHIQSQENNTATFIWQPNYNQAGSYIVDITVSDHEVTVTTPVPITVTNTNRPPELHPLGPFSVREGILLEFTAVAIDPDNDPITYSSPNLPDGATLDEQTGEFSWTPNYNQAGSYTVTIMVQDNLGGQDQEDVDIEVENVNQSPILNSLPPSFTVNEGELLTFTLNGSDPDNDPITYHANSLPQGATLDENTGVFSWTPAYVQAGTYDLTFYATDSYGAHSNLVPTQIIVIDVHP